MPKFSINFSEEILAQVDARAAASEVTRAEIIREDVTRACTQTASPEASETVTQDNPEVTRLREQVQKLEATLLEERAGRIEDLEKAQERQAQETARFQVLLQGAQKALPPPRAGLIPSLKALLWGRSSEPIDIGEG